MNDFFILLQFKLYLLYNAWGIKTLEMWLKEGVKGLQEKTDKNCEDLKIID